MTQSCSSPRYYPSSCLLLITGRALNSSDPLTLCLPNLEKETNYCHHCKNFPLFIAIIILVQALISVQLEQKPYMYTHLFHVSCPSGKPFSEMTAIVSSIPPHGYHVGDLEQ